MVIFPNILIVLKIKNFGKSNWSQKGLKNENNETFLYKCLERSYIFEEDFSGIKRVDMKSSKTTFVKKIER